MILAIYIVKGLGLLKEHINPSNAEATFVQSTRMQRFLKKPESCRVGIHWTLSHEYPFARVSVIFHVLASLDIGQISHQQYKGLYNASERHQK